MAPLLPLDSNLISAGDRILVAVSGGADSLALLHRLTHGRGELGIDVAAVHVHHGMRDEEADADVEFLRRTCEMWGVPLEVERVDVPGLAAERRISVEEAGRLARYTAFERAAPLHQCEKIATAHHSDDQAETVLLNLFRGTGTAGLGGIPPRRSLRPGSRLEVVRPLLAVSRQRIEAYCREHGLEPREDRTNRDTRYLRSRIRHELLPALEAAEPRLRENLLRLARQAREESEYLDQCAARLFKSIAVETRSPCRRWLPPQLAPLPLILRDGLVQAPPPIARRALKRMLIRIAQGEIEIDGVLLDRLLTLVHGQGPAALDLPGAPIRVRRVGAHLLLERTGVPEPPPPVRVDGPGTTDGGPYGLRLTVRDGRPPESWLLPPEEAVLDRAAVKPPLVLRPPRPGERFRPLGAPGSKLLSDYFNSRGISPAERRIWPLLADAEGVLWLVGLGIAERGRVTHQSERTLHLRAEPLALTPDQSDVL